MGQTQDHLCTTLVTSTVNISLFQPLFFWKCLTIHKQLISKLYLEEFHPSSKWHLSLFLTLHIYIQKTDSEKGQPFPTGTAADEQQESSVYVLAMTPKINSLVFAHISHFPCWLRKLKFLFIKTVSRSDKILINIIINKLLVTSRKRTIRTYGI